MTHLTDKPAAHAQRRLAVIAVYAMLAPVAMVAVLVAVVL